MVIAFWALPLCLGADSIVQVLAAFGGLVAFIAGALPIVDRLLRPSKDEAQAQGSRDRNAREAVELLISIRRALDEGVPIEPLQDAVRDSSGERALRVWHPLAELVDLDEPGVGHSDSPASALD